jgi:hypothetical protein
VNEQPEPRLQAVHRALADPLRIRLFEDVLLRAREHPDEDGTWTTVLWTAVDREDRRGGSAGRG